MNRTYKYLILGGMAVILCAASTADASCTYKLEGCKWEEQLSEVNIPSSVEDIAAIVAEKMGIKYYPLPVVKDMTQAEFDFSHWKESNHDNTIRATWPRFFYKENVINYSFKWPLDRLAHEIVHYFQQLSGIDMDSEDIYYDLEQQASEIQLWFRAKYSRGM